jgi:hypothetical protein
MYRVLSAFPKGHSYIVVARARRYASNAYAAVKLPGRPCIRLRASCRQNFRSSASAQYSRASIPLLSAASAAGSMPFVLTLARGPGGASRGTQAGG